MTLETPMFKQPQISKEQMEDFVVRVNAYRNGARNVTYSEEEIRMKLFRKLRSNIHMTVEEGVQEIIDERSRALDGLNKQAA